MIFLFFSFLQLASFLVGSCAISLSSMLDVPILKYLARLSQSYAMANMYLIVRAWCLDRNYYSPNTGRGYAQKRDSSSADHDRWWTTLAQVTGVLGVRKIPLGKFPQRMFYSVLLLIFFLKYNIVDFPGYDDIVGYCYVPAYGLFLYGLCVVFFENDVNQEEASVYRWAILSLVVGVVLWSDVFHLGGALNNVVNEMIIAWFVTPCTVFAVLLLDERLEKGRDTSKIILTTEEEGAEVEKKKIVLGRIQTWRLRCSVVVAVLALVAASVVGLLSNGKMCFHPEDMVTSEQKEWCETGRVLMTSK
jgi:hypothetical protein